jgi:hypothetical protein
VLQDSFRELVVPALSPGLEGMRPPLLTAPKSEVSTAHPGTGRMNFVLLKMSRVARCPGRDRRRGFVALAQAPKGVPVVSRTLHLLCLAYDFRLFQRLASSRFFHYGVTATFGGNSYTGLPNV